MEGNRISVVVLTAHYLAPFIFKCTYEPCDIVFFGLSRVMVTLSLEKQVPGKIKPELSACHNTAQGR